MLDPNHVEAIPWYLCRGTHPIIFSVHSDSVTTPTPCVCFFCIFLYFFCIFLYFFCIFFVFFLHFFCIFFVFFFLVCGILQLVELCT